MLKWGLLSSGSRGVGKGIQTHPLISDCEGETLRRGIKTEQTTLYPFCQPQTPRERNYRLTSTFSLDQHTFNYLTK